VIFASLQSKFDQNRGIKTAFKPNKKINFNTWVVGVSEIEE
jgi:hypothetical protein